MDPDRFWQLIEASGRQTEDCEEQAENLADRLALLEPEEIVAFDDLLADRLRESYRWDLWAVAHIINGGCSDDGFDYFCSWVIARGRTFFEAALRAPERAAEAIPSGEEGYFDCECEAILGAAPRAYRNKTGSERPLPARRPPFPREPSGEPWDEDDLDALYPALVRRFFGEEA